MNDFPQISVVIRTWDKQRFDLLKRSILSVVTQTTKESIELIVVHNGEDAQYRKDIIKHMDTLVKDIVNKDNTHRDDENNDNARKDSAPKGTTQKELGNNQHETQLPNNRTIKLIHCDMSTPGAAANAGWDAAKGKWLFFLDDDDYLTLGLFEYLLSIAGTGACFVQSMRIEGNLDTGLDNYINRGIRAVYYEEKRSYTTHYMVAWSLLYSVAGKLFNKAILDNFYKFDEEVLSGEDLLFWLCNYSKLQKGIVVPNLNVQEGYFVNLDELSNSRSVCLKDRTNLVKKLDKALKSAKNTEHTLFGASIQTAQKDRFGRLVHEPYSLTNLDTFMIFSLLYDGVSQQERESELLQIISEQEAIIARQRRQLKEAGVIC